MRNRDEIKRLLEEAFRREFPNDTVDVSDGYRDNVHVVVVSRRFDAMEERAQQDLLWGVIDRTGLTKEEETLISLVLPASPGWLK